MKYYFVSYYARLKGNGFGFGRDYIAVPEGEHFSVDKMEHTVAMEAGLNKNDVSVISRQEVSVEEYNTNKA